MRLLFVAFIGFIFGLQCPANSQLEEPDTHEEYIKIVDTLQIDDLRNSMLGVGSEGLNFRRYWSEDMEWYYQQGMMSQGLKDQANENYLRLLQDISTGIVDPDTMGPDVRVHKKKFLTVKQLRLLFLTSGGQGTLIIQSAAPQSPIYKDLRKALQQISEFCTKREWNLLPTPKMRLSFGLKDEVIPFLKERLRQYGYFISTSDDLFDEEVLVAVTDIQWLLRLKPDGVISPIGRTWNYLNVSCLDRMRQIRHDMEKLRWFQTEFEGKFIFVNLAMTTFALIDGANQSDNHLFFRTINGRPTRPTPTMKDRVVSVIINPFWVVPPTIFREDKIEELRYLTKEQIAEYFELRHYEVWNKNFTEQIDPTTIDWANLDRNADSDFYIRQRPHLGNALGVLKFQLTNSYAIYLHDTNQRELFNGGQRLLSSGCVRLERPLELAEYILRGTNWTQEIIENTMAQPGQIMDGETRATPLKSTPLYMVFLTSQKGSNGVIRFVEDSYGQNRRLLQKGVW